VEPGIGTALGYETNVSYRPQNNLASRSTSTVSSGTHCGAPHVWRKYEHEWQ